jgi:hypothetical protein
LSDRVRARVHRTRHGCSDDHDVGPGGVILAGEERAAAYPNRTRLVQAHQHLKAADVAASQVLDGLTLVHAFQPV